MGETRLDPIPACSRIRSWSGFEFLEEICMTCDLQNALRVSCRIDQSLWIDAGDQGGQEEPLERPGKALIVEDHSQPWYAVRVKSNFERAVASSVEGRGLTSFLPLYRTRRTHFNRVEEVDLPLLPGYLFARFDFSNRLPVLQIPGVVHVVSHARQPAPVEEAEIRSLQRIVDSGTPAAPWPFLECGRRVRIDKGSMRGVEGILLKIKNRLRIVVSITLLQRSVAVEIDRDLIQPVF